MKCLIVIITYIFSILFLYCAEFTDFTYSIYMCINFLFILLVFWNINKASLLLFFTITFSFLFIGGRFWAVLLGYDASIWDGNFFDATTIEGSRRKELLLFVISFLYCMLIGYMTSGVTKNKIEDNQEILFQNKLWDSLLFKLFIVLGIFSLYSIMQIFHRAILDGYLSLFVESQNSSYSGANFITILLYICFGLAFVYGSRKIRMMYLTLFLIQNFIALLIGTRGGLGALLMFFLWFYAQKKEINILKLLLLGVISLFCLLFVFQYSLRMVYVDEQMNVMSIITDFLYKQGISLSVFEVSRDLDYPLIPYFNSLLPGVSKLYSLFTGESLNPWDVSFASFLSYSLNSELFLRGNGLGWTLLGDLYLYSGRNIVFFIFLSLLFGFGVGKLEYKSTKFAIGRIIQFSIFLPFMLLPRTGLNTILPLIVYIVVVHFILKRIVYFKIV